ncbi:MAG TPA: DUF2190 family protein [Phycisphaerae bacterium]|nr:DUF2190 family protein [Phycisphaerae bacterium]
MEARFINEGNVIDYTPAADISAGSVVVNGSLVGVVPRDMTAGQMGTLQMSGVFEVAKATGADTAISFGLNVYWDENMAIVVTDANGGIYMGKAVKAAADEDVTVLVRLDQ